VSSKPLVYIAGPITKPNMIETAHRGISLYMKMIRHGVVVPFCPHLSVFAEFLDPNTISYKFWLDHDFEVIRHCQALLRMPGESSGADQEIDFANNQAKIPVFYLGEDESGLEHLYDWVNGREPGPDQVIGVDGIERIQLPGWSDAA
jgi:hypothetical protein